MDFRKNFSNEQEIDEYINSLSREQLEWYVKQRLKFYISEIPNVEVKKGSLGELIKYICFEKYSWRRKIKWKYIFMNKLHKKKEAIYI